MIEQVNTSIESKLYIRFRVLIILSYLMVHQILLGQKRFLTMSTGVNFLRMTDDHVILSKIKQTNNINEITNNDKREKQKSLLSVVSYRSR